MKSTGILPSALSQCEKEGNVDRSQYSRIFKLKAEYPWDLCDPHYGTWEVPNPTKYPQCETQRATASLVRAHNGKPHYSPDGALTFTIPWRRNCLLKALFPHPTSISPTRSQHRATVYSGGPRTYPLAYLHLYIQHSRLLCISARTITL